MIKKQPKDAIFFIDTTHNSTKTTYVKMNFRKSCTVESTAKLNSNKTIYILFTTPVKHPRQCLIDVEEYAAVKEIYKLDNVIFRSLNVTRFVEGTPVEKIFSSGMLEKSLYPKVHLSDILRLVVLWRYGGTYLDLDLLMMKSLYDLGENYAGKEMIGDDKQLNNAVLNFRNDGIGREITESCMRDIVKNYVPKGWATNGPFLVTRVINKICNDIQDTNCGDFHAVPYWFFNPYNSDEFKKPFKPEYLQQGLKDVKRSYALHLYSHLSDGVQIEKSQELVLYGVLAEKCCPDSYHNSGDNF